MALGWDSPKTVEKVHWLFESLETISLIAAIALELTGMRLSSDIAWVALVISDAGRWIYGRREKSLSSIEAERATAAVNLERAKLSAALNRRTVSRYLNQDEESELVKALTEFSGQVVQIEASVFVTSLGTPAERDSEQLFFVGQLRRIVRGAGWKEESTLLPDPGVRKGVTMFVEGHTSHKAAECLSWKLAELQIACNVHFPTDKLPVPLIISVGLL